MSYESYITFLNLATKAIHLYHNNGSYNFRGFLFA